MTFGSFWTPAMALLSDEAEARGLEYAYAFALINIAWAPGQAIGAVGGGALAAADLGHGSLPDTRLRVPDYVCRPMAIQKLLVANRGEIAARIFRACRETGIGTVAVAAPDDLGALPHAPRGRDGRDPELPVLRGAHPGGADGGRRRDPSRVRLPRREPGLRGGCRGGRAALRRADARGAPSGRGQARGEADRGRSRSSDPARRRAGRDRLPARGQGGGRRRRPRDEGRPRSGRARGRDRGGPRARRRPRSATTASTASASSSGRATSRSSSSPTSTEPSSRSASASARSSAATRRCSRSRPRPRSTATCATRMSDAAVAFGRALGYRSAGTVEFMLDGRDFYLLELNGRIQVEHPVTELVTGVDIVQEQLRIAAGETLQQTVTRSEGHAVEVRLYAEDPRTFLPQAGRIERLRLPTGIRVDAGVDEGDEVGRRLRPDDREADRPRADPRRGAAPASRRARRDRRRRPDDEPPVPALARRAPGRPGRAHDDRVPLRVRAALRPAGAPAERAVGRRVAHEPPAARPAHAARRRRALARRGRPVGRRAERA